MSAIPTFDPSDAAERRHHLDRRLAAAVRRIGDAATVARVGRALVAGGRARELFDLLLDGDARVSAAAHECAMLRFGYVAAMTAEAFGFDALERDDLVQRTFLDLPRVVRRATLGGAPVTFPEGWLRRRAGLIARQMLREGRGRRESLPIDAIDTIDAIDATVPAAGDGDDAELVHDALGVLAAERPLWALVLRLYYLEGYALDEIARRVGRSHGTVRNDAQRARLRLLAIIRARHPDAARQRGRRHE